MDNKLSYKVIMKNNMPKITTSKWLLLLIAAAIYITTNLTTVKAAASENEEIPGWVSFQEKELKTSDKKVFELSDKHVIYKDGKGKTLWESKEDYLVQDEFITDIDRNGDEELILLLWKKGRYGKDKPFWVKGDEDSFSQHIGIYDIGSEGKVSAKWFASDIGRQVTRMKLMEKDNAILLTEDIDENCALWMWESFGLKNINNEVKFIAFGDNIIHKEIYQYAARKEKGSYDFLYKPFKKEIEEADIAAIAAETILVDKNSAVSGYPSFGSPLAVGEAIKNAGFDIAVCANNHALDKGIYGIDVTTDFYRENKITCVGIQKSSDKEYKPYEIISRNGIRFALFSYTYGTNDIDVSDKYPFAVHYLPKTDAEKKRVIGDIEKAKKESDFIIVFVHWGDEYSMNISKEQKAMTELFSKTEADVIIGTHPHVVQKTELIDKEDGGKLLVYYSLGNFRADQGKDKATKTGEEAIFYVAHTYDGVRLKKWETKELNSYWKE